MNTSSTQSDCSLNCPLLSGPQKQASEAQFTSVMRDEQGSLWGRWQLTETRDSSNATCDHRRQPQTSPHVSITLILLGILF